MYTHGGPKAQNQLDATDYLEGQWLGSHSELNYYGCLLIHTLLKGTIYTTKQHLSLLLKIFKHLTKFNWMMIVSNETYPNINHKDICKVQGGHYLKANSFKLRQLHREYPFTF